MPEDSQFKPNESNFEEEEKPFEEIQFPPSEAGHESQAFGADPQPGVESPQVFGADPAPAVDPTPSFGVDPAAAATPPQAFGADPVPASEEPPAFPSAASPATFGDPGTHVPLGESVPVPDPPPQGNRPASGATHKLPGEVLSEDFAGSESAGDFLGLDVELTGAMPELPPGFGAPTPPAPELDVAPAPRAPSALDYEAEYDLDGPTEIMHVDDEEALAEEGYEDYEDYEGFDEQLDEEAGSGRGKLVIGAFAAGLIVVVGATLGPRFLSKPSPVTPRGGTDVARVPTNPAAGVDGAGEDGASATSGDPAAGGVEAGAVDPTPVEVADPTPVEDPTAGSIVSPSPGFEDDLLATLGDVVEGDPTPDPVDLLAGLEDVVEPGDVNTAEAFPDFDGGYEWVSEDMLDMVWRGNDVPMEAIFAPARTLMPRVGDVRVHMTSGELMEGRLYAVGQHRVWLDIEAGRIGLDGETVERFEHLAVPAGTSGPVYGTGVNVRVAVPGGAMFGRVIAQDGDRVTLMTPEGARVTLAEAKIEPIGTGRAVVVQR